MPSANQPGSSPSPLPKRWLCCSREKLRFRWSIRLARPSQYCLTVKIQSRARTARVSGPCLTAGPAARGGLAWALSDPVLPGARKAGALDCVLDDQASLAGFRLGTKTAGDRVQKRAHERNVRVPGTEFRFHPIDELKHVVLIAPRESERSDRLMHGAQGLMDPIQVCGFHRIEFARRVRNRSSGRTNGPPSLHGPCRLQCGRAAIGDPWGNPWGRRPAAFRC